MVIAPDMQEKIKKALDKAIESKGFKKVTSAGITSNQSYNGK